MSYNSLCLFFNSCFLFSCCCCTLSDIVVRIATLKEHGIGIGDAKDLRCLKLSASKT